MHQIQVKISAKKLGSVFIFSIIFFSMIATSLKASTEVVQQWLQWNDNNSLEVRAVIPSNERCKDLKLQVQNQSVIAQERVGNDKVFDNKVCYGIVNDTPINKDNWKPRKVKRIAIIGDTGCRVSELGRQKCYDSNAWPFEKISDLAAAHKPDLIIHLGDYLYKTIPCPFTKELCYKHYGDNQGNWTEEFFTPARNLLNTAPWIFVRGNHEKCDYRLACGHGFSRMLSASSVPKCTKDSHMYNINTEYINFIVVDVAYIKNHRNFLETLEKVMFIARSIRSWENVKDFYHIARKLLIKPENSDYMISLQKKFSEIDKFIEKGKQNWLLLHVPIFRLHGHLASQFDNKYYIKYGIDRLPDSIDAIFSGDTHSFQVLKFKGNRRTQFIVGNGGSSLYINSLDSKAYIGKKVFDNIFEEVKIMNEFGFAIANLNESDNTWSLTAMDTHGKERTICRILGNKEGTHCLS